MVWVDVEKLRVACVIVEIEVVDAGIGDVR
jgi:hypothetical protein